jgi:hypothetical protein
MSAFHLAAARMDLVVEARDLPEAVLLVVVVLVHQYGWIE